MAARKMPADDEIVLWVTEFIESNGYSPTVRELAAECDVAVTTAHTRIFMLERDGRLLVNPGIARSLRPVKA